VDSNVIAFNYTYVVVVVVLLLLLLLPVLHVSIIVTGGTFS
jgi:hypothetical protein